MLIIFTGEKDEKKQKTNKQNLFVEKKRKRKSGGKKSPECGRARLLFSVLYVRK